MSVVDHVVVGAGAAGCVVATRLSDNPAESVLLLEAGSVSPPASAAASGRNFFGALGESERRWTGLLARRTHTAVPREYARGKGLGGSAGVNAMLAVPGEPGDYDRWRDEFGADGWAWADVAGRSETIVGRPSPDPPTPLDRALSHAASDVEPARFFITADGRRDNAGGVLASRPNITMRGGALVDRVLLDARVATGVRLAGGEEVIARHVWLCAGAIQSPAILLRSAVGRRGIGANLRDHPSAQAFVMLRPEGRVGHVDRLPFTVYRRFSSGIGGIAHDLQMLPMGFLGTGTDAQHTGLLMVAVMSVRSSGTVTLASDAPLAPPIVDFKMLSDSRDLARLRVAVAELIRVARHRAVEAIASDVVVEDLGSDLGAIDDDWLLAHTGDYVHASGTCRMGRIDDDDAVVDAGLQVIGYDGLWVVDASVMPDIPRANTHQPTVVIAHHAMDRWRDQGGRRESR